MIEVILQLKLESFLVNSMGEAEDLSSQMSTRALRFSCVKVAGARLIVDNKPTADFEFLGAASKPGARIESDQEFDSQVVAYLAANPKVDASRVMLAFGTTGYSAAPKTTGSGEVGRMFINELPNQKSIILELLFKPEEFDAVWDLTTKQKVQNVLATLSCFKSKPDDAPVPGGNKFVAGVLSCSLQLVPNE
ncbi:MAG: hypothetical protein PHQ60_03105 [Sideroxydans sp.]|nr:hypothetical protein [Sideroxydans sp.]